MRILIVHNAYQQRGGEDSVVEHEARLLRDHGHVIELYGRDNHEIDRMPRVKLAADTLWSSRTVKEFSAMMLDFKPDVVHVHNTFPLISPSIYWSAHEASIPIVQTLHNFRLLCPQAMLLRNGQVCEDCVGRVPWRAATRRCYRQSFAQSALLAGMFTLHRALGTWQHKVSRYIALNQFSRQKFIEGGLPAERIVVKPNFVDSPSALPETLRDGMLFVGRLSPEKGIRTLAGAARKLPAASIKVIGSGDEAALLSDARNLQLLGYKNADEVRKAMCQATALVLPSICYENFPKTLVEAFACGLPVIASRLGAMASLIRDGETGLLFEPGNAEDLASKLSWAQSHPEKMRSMGIAARTEYETKYTPDINYRQLMAIYRDAIAEAR